MVWWRLLSQPGPGAEDDEEEAVLSIEGSFSRWSGRSFYTLWIYCTLYTLCRELDKFHFWISDCALHTVCTVRTIYTLYTIYWYDMICILYIYSVHSAQWHDLTASSAVTNAFYKSRLGTTKQLIRSHWKHNPKYLPASDMKCGFKI